MQKFQSCTAREGANACTALNLLCQRRSGVFEINLGAVGVALLNPRSPAQTQHSGLVPATPPFAAAQLAIFLSAYAAG